MKYSYKYSKLSKVTVELNLSNIKEMIEKYITEKDILPKDKKPLKVDIELNPAWWDDNSDKYDPETPNIEIVYHYEEKLPEN